MLVLENLSLEELIAAHYAITKEAFESGVTPAFDELVHRLHIWVKSPIRSFVRLLDLDEITQEVWMDIFNQAPVIWHANEPIRRKHAKREIRHVHPEPLAASGAASGDPESDHGRFDPSRNVPFKAWMRKLLIYKALTKVARIKRRADLHHLLRWADECETDVDVTVLAHELMAGLNELEAYVVREHSQTRTFQAIANDLHLDSNTVYRAHLTAIQKMKAMAGVATS